jgi:hypothetical protein
MFTRVDFLVVEAMNHYPPAENLRPILQLLNSCNSWLLSLRGINDSGLQAEACIFIEAQAEVGSALRL